MRRGCRLSCRLPSQIDSLVQATPKLAYICDATLEDRHWHARENEIGLLVYAFVKQYGGWDSEGKTTVTWKVSEGRVILLPVILETRRTQHANQSLRLELGCGAILTCI
jgi:hypothetical protein